MKKLIYALLISLVVLTAPSFAASNWKYIGTTANGNKWYVDINSICIGGMWDCECSSQYTAKIMPGGAGKNAFDNHYGQPVASIIDECSEAEGRRCTFKRKVYNTSGKLIKQEEMPSFFGDSESAANNIAETLAKYVNKVCNANKMYRKLERLMEKHKDKIVTVYASGKVTIEK